MLMLPEGENHWGTGLHCSQASAYGEAVRRQAPVRQDFDIGDRAKTDHEKSAPRSLGS